VEGGWVGWAGSGNKMRTGFLDNERVNDCGLEIKCGRGSLDCVTV
jgi:hypothetical protein